MVKKYRYGKPIETEAVIDKREACSDALPFFRFMENSKNDKKTTQMVFTYAMEDSDIVYGLGENMRGINKRGYRYRSLCADDPNHTEEKQSLYGAHNFIVISGKEHIGLFVDYPGEVVFDVGFTDYRELVITIATSDADLYVITGETDLDIIHEFRGLIGRSYIPPRWGMGFGQCRWSYPDEQSIDEVISKYRQNDIPIDSVYMDIDYMERYKDFTISEERFPDFSDYVKKTKEQGIRLVPIIDAGVKIEENYPVYEEGVQKGYFCKDENGKDFVAAVWPGRVHFPDVLNSEARRWFGDWYRVLLEQGIEGFWNDMNEPSIFYTEEHLKEVIRELQKPRNENMDMGEFWDFTGLMSGLSNNQEDYKRFYHNMNGQKVRHDLVHNLYGFNMTRAAGEAMDRLEPDKRILLFSRSSYIGMHRYGGIWTGDNQSWWSHILLSMKQMVGLNMCGLLFTGSDIGGFGSQASEDLVMRFTQWGLFTPLMRNHSAMGTRRQEAYAFARTATFAKIIDLRYFFLPYLYSEFMRAALHDEMYFYPMAMLYPQDTMAREVEDQLFIGEGMMIAPVYVQNAAGRYVYLPEPMKLYRFRGRDDYDTELMEQGHHYVPCALEEVLVFVRPDYIIPCSYLLPGQHAKNTDDVQVNQLVLLSNASGNASYRMYTDDGLTKEYEKPEHWIRIEVSEEDKATGHDMNGKSISEIMEIR